MSNKFKKQYKTLGKYQVIRTLGSGMLKVKLVCDPATGEKFAAKVCKYNLKKPALEKEANIIRELNKLDIPNVIKCIEYVDSANYYPKNNYQLDCNTQPAAPEYDFKAALILELASNETIFDVVLQNGKLDEKVARTYFKKLAETVTALHEKGYVHRDLKLENILLDENFNLKLADFGFSRDFAEHNRDKMTTKLGTESYMAPEMYTSKNYSGVKSDAFACGVLLFLFVFGRPPFFKSSTTDPFYKHFIQGKPEKFWSIYEEKINDNKEFDKGLKSLISGLLASNPEERLDVGKIGESEWIQGDVYTGEELTEVMKGLKEAASQGAKKGNK